LADYRDHYQDIRAAGADVVAISVDTPQRSELLRRQLALPFTILSDADRRVVNEWNILNRHERHGIAKPSVFIIDPDLRVRYASIDDTMRRIVPNDVLPPLRGIATESAPRRRMYIPRLRDWRQALRNNFRSLG
jgi:peroxiredoxin